MSVASEITRLQNAKASLKTAIEAKGVTVSSSTKLDGYADLVDSISGGGGDDDYWYFLTADSYITTVNDEALRQIYLGYGNNSTEWIWRANVIGGSAQGLKCWFRYKGEDYFVDSFSDGVHTLSKQGAPISCTISDLLEMHVFKDNDVYKIEYHED